MKGPLRGKLRDPQLYHPERGEQRDQDRLVDQVDKQRVPPEREKWPGKDRRLPCEERGSLLATVHHVAGEKAEEDDPEPGEQGPVVRHDEILRHHPEGEQPRALRREALNSYVKADRHEEEAQEEVHELVLQKGQKGVSEYYGDPDQV